MEAHNVHVASSWPEADGTTFAFSENVRAEELMKAATLNRITSTRILAAGEDSDEEDVDESDIRESVDVRKELFERMPEPYPHSEKFQRVYITDTGEGIDADTRTACSELRKCMDMRAEWLYPLPEPYGEAPSPASPRDHEDNVFRRRDPPEYDPFSGEVRALAKRK
jgi:hypothetical protein